MAIAEAGEADRRYSPFRLHHAANIEIGKPGIMKQAGSFKRIRSSRTPLHHY